MAVVIYCSCDAGRGTIDVYVFSGCCSDYDHGCVCVRGCCGGDHELDGKVWL